MKDKNGRVVEHFIICRNPTSREVWGRHSHFWKWDLGLRVSRSQVPCKPTWGSKYAAMRKRLELGARSRLLALGRGEKGVLEAPGMTRKSGQAWLTHTDPPWTTPSGSSKVEAPLVLGRVTARTLGKPSPSLLELIMEPFWCWDKPRVNSDSLWTHTHSGLGSKPPPHSLGGEASILPPWGNQSLPPYSILCDSSWGWHPNGHFVPGLPGLPRLWGFITFGADLRSTCRLKQSCRSRRDLSNGMSHVLCSQVFRVDSRLLVVGSQNWRTPGSSTPGPSFGHNLCFRCPNEQCEPILDIYTLRPFHWYK